jgi:hypothetical protein
MARVTSYSMFRSRTSTLLSSALTSMRSSNESTWYSSPYLISTWKYEFTTVSSWLPMMRNGKVLME